MLSRMASRNAWAAASNVTDMTSLLMTGPVVAASLSVIQHEFERFVEFPEPAHDFGLMTAVGQQHGQGDVCSKLASSLRVAFRCTGRTEEMCHSLTCFRTN